MKRFKNALYLATVASSAIIASAAHAQTPSTNDGEAVLHGIGSTSIELALVQELNCLGGYSDLGLIGNKFTAGITSAIAEPTNLPTSFNCATTDLEPGFLARYIGSGSGTGQTAWANAGSVNTIAAFNFTAPQPNPNPLGTWTSVQFAFSDSSVSDRNLTTYTGGAGLTGASYVAGGAPVQFPKFVLPVAIGYSPVYGHNTANGHDYSFNIQFPQNILGNAAGGLRLSRQTYCAVFNGTITNFNNSNFTTDNGGVSLMDAADSTDNGTRWSTDGVPVRLVGRMDNSGTTDIFTRALAAQCGTVASGNHYAQNAQVLPYKRSDSATIRPVFDSVRADTGLATASTQAEAGNGMTNTMVGAEYFDGTSIVTPSANTGKTTSQPTGNVGSGLFLVADGSGKVAKAIALAPDYLAPASATVKLNGKIGYIGADFIDGSPSAPGGVKAAALQNPAIGSGGDSWLMPSAQNASNAFGTTVRPPQSTMNGTLSDSAADTRQVRIPTYMGGGTGNATRNNPLAWYDVLYVPATTGGPTLALPSQGYPITGTTQFVGYSCYKSGNAAAILNFLDFNTDYVTTNDSTGNDRTGIFTGSGTSTTDAGLLSRSNIAPLPNLWKHAVRETFLVNSTETSSVHSTLGGYNLWINNASSAGCNTSGTARTGL